MKVHLIFVTKYRKNLFRSGEYSSDVKQFLCDASKSYCCKVIRIETDSDHVHMLIEYSPKLSVSEIVKELKQHSTHKMWEHHEAYLSEKYWKRKVIWSDGYFACSIGQVSQAVIEKYIQNQG